MTINITKADLLLRRMLEDDGAEGLVALNLLRKMLKGQVDAFRLTDTAKTKTNPLLWAVRQRDAELELLREQNVRLAKALRDSNNRLEKLKGHHRPLVEAKFMDQYRDIIAAIRSGDTFRKQIVVNTGYSEATVRRRCVEMVNSMVLKADGGTNDGIFSECYTIANEAILGDLK